MHRRVARFELRSRPSNRASAGVFALFVGISVVTGCGGARANAPSRTGKLAPELATWLGQSAPGGRTGVIADFSDRPRSSDMLALGLSDCLGQPAAPAAVDSQLSLDAYDLRHPAPAFGAMCVGHPTREALLRLIDNASVTSLDPWNDK